MTGLAWFISLKTDSTFHARTGRYSRSVSADVLVLMNTKRHQEASRMNIPMLPPYADIVYSRESGRVSRDRLFRSSRDPAPGLGREYIGRNSSPTVSVSGSTKRGPRAGRRISPCSTVSVSRMKLLTQSMVRSSRRDLHTKIASNEHRLVRFYWLEEVVREFTSKIGSFDSRL